MGAGPAGLTAAYYLCLLGNEIDLYDSFSKPGGMLRYGIPRYRLPANILDAEINDILSLGVKFHPDRKINSLEELSEYDALLWTTGASLTVPLPKGTYNEGTVVDGLDFLKRINFGEKISYDGAVAVIGGGNVATDVARTVSRMGAGKVTVIYRRTRDEMPAYESEIDEMLKEGVEIRFLLEPVSVSKCNGKIKVVLQKMKLGEPDSSGRRSPVPLEGESSEMMV
ncbi:MAG: FAD-dependent oxidoreductase, partial [Candidatus Zixiibacteriota bacterium]